MTCFASRQSLDRNRERAWQQPHAGYQRMAMLVLQCRTSAKALHDHDHAGDDDQAVAKNRERRRRPSRHQRHLVQHKAQHDECGQPRQHMQECCRQRNANALADVSLTSEEIGGQGCFAVARRQCVQRAERKSKGGGAQTTRAHFGGEGAHDPTLDLRKPKHQPI